MGLTSLGLVSHSWQHEEGLSSSAVPRERQGMVKSHEGARETGSYGSPAGTWMAGPHQGLVMLASAAELVTVRMLWFWWFCFSVSSFYQHSPLFSYLIASAYSANSFQELWLLVALQGPDCTASHCVFRLTFVLTILVTHDFLVDFSKDKSQNELGCLGTASHSSHWGACGQCASAGFSPEVKWKLGESRDTQCTAA